jgi:hypothetical protein
MNVQSYNWTFSNLYEKRFFSVQSLPFFGSFPHCKATLGPKSNQKATISGTSSDDTSAG